MENIEMLEQDLNVLLATSFAFAVQAQRYHWNVMSMHFYAHHEFYQEVYEEVYEHVDIIGEAIRTLGKFPIGTLSEFNDLSQISEEEGILTDCTDQLRMLAKSNDVILRIIKIAMTAAKEEDAEDVLDLLVNRQRAHKKHGWMINAHLNQQQR